MTLTIPQITAILVAFFFGLYALCAPSYFIGGDHIVFAFVAAAGTYAHAPGYPLFSLICRLCAMFSTNAIYATNIGTCLLGALSVAVTFRALVAWRIDPTASACAAATFGAIPHVMFLHTQAEVFALNHLLAASILWACAPTKTTTARHVALLGLLAGLALSHHHTIVFLAPLGLWASITKITSTRNPIGSAVAGMAGLVVGLTPYFYLCMVATMTPTTFHWGDPTTISGLIDIFLRRDFGTLSMTVEDGPGVSPLNQWSFLARSSAANLLYVGVPVVIYGAVCLLKKQRSLGLALAACSVLSGPVFVALFHREPVGLDELLVEKFHLLFWWTSIPMIACAFEDAFRRNRRRVAAVLTFVAALLVAAVLHTKSLQDAAPDDYIHDLWSTLPANAVLIATGDHATAGSWYLNTVEGRGDTIAAELLAHKWYRAQVNSRLGITTADTGTYVDLVEFIEAVQAKGRPVFMTSMLDPRIAQKFPTYPMGLSIVVEVPGAATPDPMTAAARNAEIFDGFRFQGIVGQAAGPWGKMIATEYAKTWKILADAFRRMNDTRSAQQAEAMASHYVSQD